MVSAHGVCAETFFMLEMHVRLVPDSYSDIHADYVFVLKIDLDTKTGPYQYSGG